MRDHVRRMVRGILASAATGLLIYLLAIDVALPRIAGRLTGENREWLREAFLRHPVGILIAILGIAAILALPVLGVFRWVYGPLRRRD